jgi:S-formylglutathione hydrolase FrmB
MYYDGDNDSSAEHDNFTYSDKSITRLSDTTLYVKYDCCYVVSTNIKYPPADTDIKGSILMLHGWNCNALDWCDKTTFCERALKNGYVLIMPDLSKCNYNLHVYPETIDEYKKYPTLTWIKDFYIPHLSDAVELLEEPQNNFVAGISTGARGATLLAYHLPKLFNGVASLSGDFDITQMPDEFLYQSNFGNYESFAERWQQECFAFDCKNYKTPTYIGHGIIDNLSPVSQSIQMFDSIKKHNPDMIIEKNFPENAGHDYEYWEDETNNILNFFDKLL